jgi:hypothetical protein
VVVEVELVLSVSCVAPFTAVVASAIESVRLALRSPPPAKGAVVLIVVALAALAARSVVKLVTWLSVI